MGEGNDLERGEEERGFEACRLGEGLGASDDPHSIAALGRGRDTQLSLMRCDRLQGPIHLSVSLSFLKEAPDYHLLVTRSGAPEGSTQPLRFQLAPIKKPGGSLQIHFLFSAFRPRTAFPGGAGGGAEAAGRAGEPARGGTTGPDSWRRRAGSSLGSAGSGRAWTMAAEPSVGGTGPPARPAAGAAPVALTHCPRPVGSLRADGLSADTHRAQRCAPSDLAWLGPDTRIAGSGWRAPSPCPHPLCRETA